MLRRRTLLVNKSDSEFVDLGLPSGVKWATANLKKSGDTCVIGEETDYGDFWSWANVGLTNDTGWMDSAGGIMSQGMYSSTTGASKTTNISGTDASHDVAYKYLGAPWRLPTVTEFNELINNTDHAWVGINGIQGRKFMKKTDHSVYVFFPASGSCGEGGFYNRSRYGHYWSSTFGSYSDAEHLRFDSSRIYTTGEYCYQGFSIRPVQMPHRTVTITLTGDTIEGINLTLTDIEGTRHTDTTDASGTAKFTLVAYGSATLSADGKKFIPNSITVSASAGSFTVAMSEALFVDLGLPSGLKWATANLKKSGDTCVIGGETDYGDFWSWANVGLTNSTGWMSSAGGEMNQEMYDSTTGASQQASISGTDGAHDVAYKYLRSPWRLPTKAEFEELIANTDHAWVTINGIKGDKFMKKTDHSIYVFFPASGTCWEDGIEDRGSSGYYWSSTLYDEDSSDAWRFDSSLPDFEARFREEGNSVRPVRN